jgi:membrane fusion protein (multidrug efflux system)
MQTSKKLLSLCLLTIALLAACQGKGPGTESSGPGDKGKAKEEAPPAPVEVASPSRGQMLATYSGTASIEAFAEADVIAKVGGEVLAVLDGDRLRLELKQTEANMNKLEREYKRNLDLHDRGLVSVGAFENIKYELDALKASFDRARLELSYTELRAPIDGVISERFIKVGNTLAANARTFHVTTLKPLIIYLHAPEKEYRRISAGQMAMIEVDALKNSRFPAKVVRVSPTIDPASGTFKITIEVDDPSHNLKPGMFGRVHIIYEVHENALTIPREALVVDGDEEAVFVIVDGKAERRLLSTGISRDGKVEVLGGITDDDRYVLVGQTGLKDGTSVNVVNEPKETPPEEGVNPDETASESDETDESDK